MNIDWIWIFLNHCCLFRNHDGNKSLNLQGMILCMIIKKCVFTKFSLEVNHGSEWWTGLLGPPVLQHTCVILALQGCLVSVFDSSLEVLKSTSNEKKKLCGKYCDKTIEVIMIAFPTIRAETFLFAQLRDEVGIYQRLMTFLWNASLGYTGLSFC